MKQNNADISKISNSYNLKSIFEYLDYQYILKLLKYNRKFQNNLGINIEHYQKESYYQNYQYKKKKKKFNYHYKIDKCSLGKILLTIYSIYVFLYMSNCYIKYDKESVYIPRYDNYLKFQITININKYSWIIGLLLIILSTIIYIIDEYKCEKLNEKVRTILIIITQLSQLISEGIVIWKLVLSDQIKDEKRVKDDSILNDIDDIIVLDEFFIFVHSIFTLYTFIKFRKKVKRYITTSSTYYILNSVNNIKIKSYIIPNNFIKMRKKQQFQYILNECKHFEYFLTQDQKDLIKLINEYREDNKLEKLLFDKYNKLPNFIIKKPAEIMLNPTQHFFQLSKKEYLFRYHIGEFKIQFQEKENNIINILSNNNINYIKIIGQEEYEYIFLSELSYKDILDIDERKRDNNELIDYNNDDDDYKLFKESL